MRRPSVAGDEPVAELAELDEELDLDEVIVGGHDLTGARGDGRMARSVLRGTTLNGSQFGPLELADVVFDGAALANASWRPVTARQSEFRRCRATGWRLQLDLAQDVYLGDCLLDYAVLEVHRVKGLLVFEGCSFTGAMLAGDLSNVVFADCGLDDTEFDAGKATGCDLRTSRIASARGLGTLQGAIIDLEQAMSAGPRLATEAGLRVQD